MSLIKSSSMTDSGYKVKLFMERYIIYSNWHRKSFSTLHFWSFHDDLQNFLVAGSNNSHLLRFHDQQMLVGRSHKNYKNKKESILVSFSVCKKMLRDACTLLVTCKWSIDITSSFYIIWRHLLQQCDV